MQFSTILGTASLLTLAFAAPRPRAEAPGVSIVATTSGINNPSGGPVDFHCDLNKLCFTDATVTALQVAATSGTGGIDAATVECRMYRDAEGTKSGSLPFTVATKANIATNTVEVGSILCYVLNGSEKK